MQIFVSGLVKKDSDSNATNLQPLFLWLPRSAFTCLHDRQVVLEDGPGQAAVRHRRGDVRHEQRDDELPTDHHRDDDD